MTYKEAIDYALISIKFSEDKIRDHDYGEGEWINEHRRNELLNIHEVKRKLRQLKTRL